MKFICDDLLKCDIPIADTYFFYFPTGKVLDRILFHLKQMGHEFRIVVIESHGDFIPRLEFEKWLVKDIEIPLLTPRHYPNAVVYKNNPEKCLPESFSIFDHSFLDEILYIRNGSAIWLGESLGLEYMSDNEVLLKVPPRSIPISSIEKIQKYDEVPKEFWVALNLRRLGELEIETKSGVLCGVIRKIFISPVFELEISSGAKVKWSDIKSMKWENQLCYEYSL